jgi:hypothetical protein
MNGDPSGKAYRGRFLSDGTYIKKLRCRRQIRLPGAQKRSRTHIQTPAER